MIEDNTESQALDTQLTTEDLKATAPQPEPVAEEPIDLVAGQGAEPLIQGTEDEQVAGLGSLIKALSGEVRPPSITGGTSRATESEAASVLERQALGKVVDPARTADRNFSLKYIGSESDFDDEVRRIMDNVAEEREFGSVEGMQPRSHETTLESAAEVQVDVEKFLGRKLRDAPTNADELTAWRYMLVESATELKEKAGLLIDENGKKMPAVTDEDMYEFRQMLNTYSAMQMKFQGAVKETGRMLNAMQINIGTDPLGGTNMSELLMRQGSGEVGSLKMARAIYQAKTPEEISALSRGSWLQRYGRAGYELWINGLLSGFGTQVKNVVGNTITSVMTLPEHYLAMGIGKGRNKAFGGDDAFEVGEINAMSYGLFQGYADGFRVATKNFFNSDGSVATMEGVNASKLEFFRKPEFTAENLGVNENTMLGKGVDLLGQWYVRLPGRVLEASDDLYRAVGYRMALNSEAYRRTMTEGLEPGSPEFYRRLNEIVLDPDMEIHMKSQEFARYQTFTNELQGSTSKAVQIFQTTPVGRIMLPFVRTPVNILKYATARTAPFNMVLPSWWKEYNAGGRSRDLALSRVALGTTMAATFAGLHSTRDENGVYRPRITGTPPSNPKMAELWREAGITPYSIYDDETGQYTQYNWAEPFGMQLSVMADFMLVMNDASDPMQKESAAAGFVSAIADYTTDKSYVQGFTQLMDMINKGAVSSSLRLPSSIVPTWMANIRKDMDPWKRHTRNAAPADFGKGAVPGSATAGAANAAGRIRNYFLNRIPGMSDSLQMDVDVWGNDMSNGDPIWYAHSISPSVGHAVNKEPATLELIQNNVSGREPAPVITVQTEYGPVKVDVLHLEDGEKAFYEYRKTVGKVRLQHVNSVISMPEYQDEGQPGEVRQMLLDNAMSSGLSEARGLFTSTYEGPLNDLAIEILKQRPSFKETVMPGMKQLGVQQ